jgi:parallel beta-helix repeat protein
LLFWWGSRFLNNTIYNCKNSGLTLTNNKNSTIKNNLFINNGLAQVFVSSMSVTNGGHTFRNNNYFKATKTQIAFWHGAGSVSPLANKTVAEWAQLSGEINAPSVNPQQFINPPADPHLLSTSPVKAAGEAGVDLGAYQTQGGPPPMVTPPAIPARLQGWLSALSAAMIMTSETRIHTIDA